MKILIAQLNFHIGNFDANRLKMETVINDGIKRNVDIVIFSELSVCGYPPLDLLEQKDFIDSCLDSVEKIASLSKEIGIIVGGPAINPNERGKNLYNAAYFLYGGEVKDIRYKTLLPTYDIFDEYRYFEPNTEFKVIEFRGRRIALTICEDLWDDQPIENAFARSKLYPVSPMERLIDQRPDMIINISASPFAANKLNSRKKVMSQNAAKYGLPIFYSNQVGANTELIFDGSSMVVGPDGNIIDDFAPFQEDTREYLLEDVLTLGSGKPIVEYAIVSEEYRLEMMCKALIFGIKDYFNKVGFSKATLGLSGGIDSALTLVLAVRALGAQNVRVLLMPSKYSSDHSINDSIILAKNLNISWEKIEIQKVVDDIELSLKSLFGKLHPDVTEENIQARTRGLMLMALSNKLGYILLNTSNKSEAAVGYATLYGDMNGGLSVLGDVYKTDVYALSRFINREMEIIPENIIIKPPSAELRPDQKDSDSLPDYSILDNILYHFIELKESVNTIVSSGIDEKLVRRVVSLVNRSEYKRFQSPPILRVSSKAFGLGRRIPLVAKY